MMSIGKIPIVNASDQKCKIEITWREVYTINKDIAKAKRYVDIIKEEIVNNW